MYIYTYTTDEKYTQNDSFKVAKLLIFPFISCHNLKKNSERKNCVSAIYLISRVHLP